MTTLDQTFSALGDATRRAIIMSLAAGEKPLAEVASPFDMSLTAVSKHVRVLSDAGLLSVEKRGRTRYCQLNGAPVKEAVDWLNVYRTFWDGRLDALTQHLEGKTAE